jgi:hypothetical protein
MPSQSPSPPGPSQVQTCVVDVPEVPECGNIVTFTSFLTLYILLIVLGLAAFSLDVSSALMVIVG